MWPAPADSPATAPSRSTQTKSGRYVSVRFRKKPIRRCQMTSMQLKGIAVRLTRDMTASQTLFTYFARWNERRRRKKAIEMRLATALTLLLKFPVTTALLYSQEVHYNYERG